MINAPLAEHNITLHLVKINFAARATFLILTSSVQIHDMFSYRPVSALVMFILNNENHVKSGQNRRLEVNILDNSVKQLVT